MIDWKRIKRDCRCHQRGSQEIKISWKIVDIDYEKKRENSRSSNFGISYADLMAGLLF